jgi:hypothetical protein
MADMMDVLSKRVENLFNRLGNIEDANRRQQVAYLIARMLDVFSGTYLLDPYGQPPVNPAGTTPGTQMLCPHCSRTINITFS